MTSAVPHRAPPVPAPSPANAPAQRAARLSRSAAVLSVQAHALAHARFDAAAVAALNHLAQLTHCERVSLGLVVRGRLRVCAVSGATEVAERNADIARVRAAMNEALEQRRIIVYPLPSGASPAVTLAHRALARSGHPTALCTAPIATRRELLGALLFERGTGFDGATLEAAKDAAMFAGPLLAYKQRAEDGFAARALAPLRRPAPGPLGRGRVPTGTIAALAALLAATVVALWPATERIVAPARVEGRLQHIVSAPVDGFIGSVAVRPGEAVRAGQLLFAMDARELELERDRWAAEIAQQDKHYREALSRDEAAPIVIARAKLEQAQSQYQLAQRQLERASLRAPIDGVVLSGDLSQSVGMPVKRGHELMTIAPREGARIVVEVDEQDAGAIAVGQSAQVLFAALPGEPVRVPIGRVAPVATQVDGHNVFEAEGDAPAAQDGLRPGMRGVARVEVGASRLGVIWWERARKAWRQLAWRLTG